MDTNNSFSDQGKALTHHFYFCLSKINLMSHVNMYNRDGYTYSHGTSNYLLTSPSNEHPGKPFIYRENEVNREILVHYFP